MGRGKSGSSYLGCWPCDPTLDKRLKMGGWVDGHSWMQSFASLTVWLQVLTANLMLCWDDLLMAAQTGEKKNSCHNVVQLNEASRHIWKRDSPIWSLWYVCCCAEPRCQHTGQGGGRATSEIKLSLNLSRAYDLDLRILTLIPEPVNCNLRNLQFINWMEVWNQLEVWQYCSLKVAVPF